MKYCLLIIALISFSTVSISQDYMDKIAVKACECLDNVSDTLDIEQYNMELGLCMLGAASGFEKKIKKDLKIDMNRIDGPSGEKFGQAIGLKMASICLEALTRVASKTENEDVLSNSIEGEIIRVESNPFVIFTLKDNTGKVTKFYWLNLIDSDIELLSEYESLISKSVILTYRIEEFFDPRIAEYRQFNIIETMKTEF